MGWVEETCAGQHHWPQAHRMANSLHSFQGHVTETRWLGGVSEKIDLCIWKSLFLTHKSTVYRAEVWPCFVTSGVPQHLIFFSDCEVESLLLFCSLQLFAGSLKSLHLMGTYASGYFKCNPSACLAFSNLVQQISYVTGTLLRSCGCPAGVQGFVLHKPTAPKGCSIGSSDRRWRAPHGGLSVITSARLTRGHCREGTVMSNKQLCRTHGGNWKRTGPLRV